MKSHRNNKKTRKHKNKKGGGFFNRSKKGGNPSIIFKPTDNADLKAKVKDWVKGNRQGLGHISNWDTSDITDMSDLFSGMTDFNENISSWDVSNVTNMSLMFYYATSFNQSLVNWDVSKVTTMRSMFSGASAFNQPLNSWNTSNVTIMQSMFYKAESFNQPINNWDVSKVTNMEWMFSGASAFNQPIGEWNVSNVTNMGRMFYYAEKFNQPIGEWNVSNVTNMSYMFYGARSFNDNNKPRIRLKCMSTDEFNTKCKPRDEEGNVIEEENVIDPISLGIIDKSTAVQIPGDTVNCFDRGELRKWVVELGKRTHPLTRAQIPQDWISRNLVEGNCENTDQDGGKKRKTRKMKGKRSLRKSKKI